MIRKSYLRALAVCLIGSATTFGASKNWDENWGQWRGPAANGVAVKGKPAVTWSESENIRWKRALPGQGLSTPIVWADRVYIQTAIAVGEPKAKAGDEGADGGGASRDRQGDRSGHIERNERSRRDGSPSDGQTWQSRPDGERRGGRGGEGMRRGGRRGRRRGRAKPPTQSYRYVIMALDRKTGETVWERTLRETIPHEGSHRDGSQAPASPFTDGGNVFAYFGSHGLYCLDMDGTLKWEKDLGDMRTRAGFGEGSTPALYKDTIIVPWDNEDESFIVALDRSTGAEKWRKSRDEATNWATPLIVTDTPKPQAIVSGDKRVIGYDLATGDVVWECGGLGTNCVPTPVAVSGTTIVMSGHRDVAALAIRYKNARGDVTDTDAVLWSKDKGTPYVPSPLLYGNALYYLQKNSSILSCLDPATGSKHYKQQRLEEINGVYASLVGADGKVYIVGRNGVTYVLRRGEKFEVLAINKLGKEDFSASPAIVGDEIYLRSRTHLYCIGD